jgi:hypothetical protein
MRPSSPGLLSTQAVTCFAFGMMKSLPEVWVKGNMTRLLERPM